MAQYKKIEIHDGFMRGTQTGVSVQIGTEARLFVNLKLKAKTISDVYKELSKYKSDFHADTWKKIEKLHTGGSMSFFYELFSLAAGVSYDYENQKTKQNISQDIESQRVAQALHDTDETEICILCYFWIFIAVISAFFYSIS